MKEEFLNIKEKYDMITKDVQSLKKEMIERISMRIDQIGESKSVAMIGKIYMLEKDPKSASPMLCSLKITRVLKIGKTRIAVLSEDDELNRYENEIKDLTLKECMGILTLLYTDGAYNAVPVIDLIDKEVPEEDEDCTIMPD